MHPYKSFLREINALPCSCITSEICQCHCSSDVQNGLERTEKKRKKKPPRLHRISSLHVMAKWGHVCINLIDIVHKFTLLATFCQTGMIFSNLMPGNGEGKVKLTKIKYHHIQNYNFTGNHICIQCHNYESLSFLTNVYCFSIWCMNSFDIHVIWCLNAYTCYRLEG